MKTARLLILCVILAPRQGSADLIISDQIRYISVGIDAYTGALAGGFPKQTVSPPPKSSAEGARAIAAALKAAGYESAGVVLTGADATKAKIQSAFERLAGEATSGTETVIFTFAGSAGEPPNPTSSYVLLPSDALNDTKSLSNSVITPLELKTWVSRIKAKNFLIAIDTDLQTDAQAASLKGFVRELAGQQNAFAVLSNRNLVFFFSTLRLPEGDQHESFLNRFVPLIRPRQTAWGLAAASGEFLRPYLQALMSGENFMVANYPLSDPEVARAAQAAPSVPKPPPSLSTGKSYALMIATNDYDDSHWPKLQNPVRDVEAVAAELQQHYGYEKPDILLNATHEDVEEKLAAYVSKQFDPGDSLLIYFSGHGAFNEDLKTGYLAFKNSKFTDPLYHTYLSHPELYNIANRLKAKRILLVIDACFGGTFDPQISNKRGENDLDYPLASKAEALAKKSALTTRIFLTSGGKEYVPDGRPGANSPFTTQFLRALRTYGGQTGLLSFLDIAQFVDLVKPVQPKYGWFGDAEPSSDFWFVAR